MWEINPIIPIAELDCCAKEVFFRERLLSGGAFASPSKASCSALPRGDGDAGWESTWDRLSRLKKNSRSLVEDR